MAFKVGDRVLTKTEDLMYSGLRGSVVEKEFHDAADEYRVKVDEFDAADNPIVYNESELEKIVTWMDVGDTAASQIENALAEFVETNTKTRNGYYEFPGGVEVRQISAHLTGFGAQALQYVARATRLDGKNKGDVVSDLTKAIDFIRWEIERLQGDSK